MKFGQIPLMTWAARAAILLSFATASAAEPVANKEAGLPVVKALTMMSTSIPSADVDRSIAFYTKGLGMIVAGKIEMGPVIEVHLDFPGGGATLMLLHPKAEGTSLPIRGPLSRILLIVPDLKALETQLKALGYQFKGKINEMAQYKVAVAQLEDPDGNHIELIQRLP